MAKTVNKRKRGSKIKGPIIIVGLAALAIFSFIAVSYIITPRNANNTAASTAKQAADNLKRQAVYILHSDKPKAKELLNQALKKYQEAGDDNGIVDVNAQLYLLDHPPVRK